MKNISIAIAAFCALAGQSAVASAQSARGWSPWDQGGPATAQADDDRYYDRYEQDDPRRYDDRQNGDRVYDDRYDDGRAQEQRGVRAWRNEDLDDYGQWDAAPSAAEEAQRNKAPGVSGGARPSIRPVAPPQVAFHAPYAPGSIVIDTSARKLYYVTSATTAFAYPIGVGREGFAWTGKEKVSRIADWPDWYPPADMRQRRPDLPERMLGGIGNPLGVKAIYLGNTLYRIHGTNDPKSIGKAESSGCFRMMNGNVLHLASLVKIGTEVTIVRSLKGNGSVVASSKPAPRAASPRAYNEDERTVSQRAPQPRWDDRYYDPYYRGGREPSPYDDDWR